MHNTKYIWATIILTEQYLQEQIKKAPGWLKDIFMQAVLVGVFGPPRPCIHNYRMEATQNRDSTLQTRQDIKPHKGHTRNITPSTGQTNMASLRCARRVAHATHVTMIDEQRTINVGAKSPRYNQNKIRSDSSQVT